MRVISLNPSVSLGLFGTTLTGCGLTGSEADLTILDQASGGKTIIAEKGQKLSKQDIEWAASGAILWH